MFDKFKKKLKKQDNGAEKINIPSGNGGSDFKYLDNLIHSGQKKIELTSDIVLKENEINEYADGIPLDVSGLVIDGNGHTIDAQGKARIFAVSEKTTIMNVILKNGYNEVGGAIKNNGDLTIQNSRLQDNTATQNFGGGGAIMNSSSLTIENSLFKNNLADNMLCDGGAIFNNGTLKIKESIMENNAAKRNGGAVYNNDRSSLSVMCSKFISNNAMYGGALHNDVRANMDISESVIKENVGIRKGGAIRNYDSRMIIKNTLIESNVADEGGAINNQEYGIIEMENTVIQGNAAKKHGGIIWSDTERHIEMKNCQIKNNVDTDGNEMNVMQVESR